MASSEAACDGAGGPRGRIPPVHPPKVRCDPGVRGWHTMLTKANASDDPEDDPSTDDAEAVGDTPPPAQKWAGPSPRLVGLAAALCFLDEEPDERVARRLGVARRTLARWKKRPEYAAAWAALSWVQCRELERRQGMAPGRLCRLFGLPAL